MHLLVWCLLVMTVILLLIECVPRLLPSYRLAKTIPGPDILYFWSGLHFVYTLTPVLCHDLPRQWAKQFKQTYRIWGLGRITVEVFKASVMETILCSSKHTLKGKPYRILEHFLGDGLLISNGQKWLQRRRILTPAFHFGILQRFLAVFCDEGRKLGRTLALQGEDSSIVDLSATMSTFALNTICESSMGVKLDSVTGADKYRRNIYDIGWLVLERFLKPWLHFSSVYNWSLNRRKIIVLLRPVHQFTRQVIKQHRSAIGSARDSSGGDAAAEITAHSTADSNMCEVFL